MLNNKIINASQLQDGELFCRERGTYVYLKISDSAVRFLGLNVERVYGITFNGNVAITEKQDKVRRASLYEFEDNAMGNTYRWE